MKNTKEIKIGNILIGASNPIAIQSMTNTPTKDVLKTVSQIKQLENVGCQIVRVAVLDIEDALAINEIKKQINIPIVADIHFDYRLAIKAIESGADKIRINPGNIGSYDNVKKVIDAAKQYNIPIRIGINSGSIEKELLEKYGGPTPEAMLESITNHVKLLESLDFYNIVLSIKSTNIENTIKTNRLLLLDDILKCNFTLSTINNRNLEWVELWKKKVDQVELYINKVNFSIYNLSIIRYRP